MKSPLTAFSAALLLANSAFINAAQNDQTIFISAKAPIAAQEFSGAVSVVSAQEIKASGARSVEEALSNLPGISVGTGGGTAGSEIRIRGMAAEYSLILIDGKRVANAERNISGSPSNRTNWVAIANIDRIEVIRGAASSLYGADALSGVINIITKKPQDQWQSSMTVSAKNIIGDGGSGKGINFATRGKIGERFDLSLNLDRQLNDAIISADNTSAHPDSAVSNAQLKLGMQINEEDRVELSYINGREESSSQSVGRSGLSIDELDQNKILFGLDYIFNIADFNSSLSVSNASNDIDDSGTDWFIKDKNASWSVDGALTENQYLSAGVDYREETVERPNRDFEDTFKSGSIYAQDALDINDNNTLTLGFSYEDHNKYGGALSPKIYWNTEINDQWSVKVGYAEGRMSPAIREGSSNYVISGGPGRVYMGNDDLQPEESQTAEIGFDYIGNTLSAGVSVFASDIENMITTADGGIDSSANQINLYSNVNEAEIRGLEGSVSWQIKTGRTLAFNYTYTDAVNRDGGANDGNQIIDRPKHIANLNYSQKLHAIDATVSASLQAVSAQYTDAANDTKISGYGIVNLGLVKGLSDNIELSANIINVNDKKVFDGSDAIHAGREFRLAITGNF